MPLLALTRAVSPSLARCELTHLERRPIALDRARAEHAAYEACLRELGCRLLRLPEAPDLPDAVFVEDTAVVFDEVALVARPGAVSRRGEVAPVAEALAAFRPLRAIEAPATLDGGDVLVLGREVWIGLSTRTNAQAVAQVTAVLEPYGYVVRALPVTGCLHLKSAVTRVAPETVLLNPRWIDAAAFSSRERIEVDRAEPYAANALAVGEALVYPAAFPRTRERLERRGLRVSALDLSELAKAEGAVTCCSLVFTVPEASGSRQ